MTAARPAAAPSRRRRLAAGAAVAGLAAALLLAPAPGGTDEAAARPQHFKFFAKTYEGSISKEDLRKGRCDICHEKTQPKNKKIRNPYGAELTKLLEENEKDQDKFVDALKKVAEMQSCVEDKTYGDLIEEGKLPTEGCEPVEEEDPNAVLTPIPDPNFS